MPTRPIREAWAWVHRFGHTHYRKKSLELLCPTLQFLSAFRPSIPMCKSVKIEFCNIFCTYLCVRHGRPKVRLLPSGIQNKNLPCGPKVHPSRLISEAIEKRALYHAVSAYSNMSWPLVINVLPKENKYLWVGKPCTISSNHKSSRCPLRMPTIQSLWCLISAHVFDSPEYRH